MTNKERDWIANRCVKAKEKKGIILISHIIKIVNDFNKNRTCENCTHIDLTINNFCYMFKSGINREWIKKGFGCNKFESKTVSTDTKGVSDE